MPFLTHNFYAEEGYSVFNGNVQISPFWSVTTNIMPDYNKSSFKITSSVYPEFPEVSCGYLFIIC